jgi:hypothetical protein
LCIAYCLKFTEYAIDDATEKTQYLNAKAQSRQGARENVNLLSRKLANLSPNNLAKRQTKIAKTLCVFALKINPFSGEARYF